MALVLTGKLHSQPMQNKKKTGFTAKVLTEDSLITVFSHDLDVFKADEKGNISLEVAPTGDFVFCR